MKEDILKRAMFAMPLSKEARGSGIMSGFDMEDMEDEGVDVDDNADLEEMPPMARTPQNPEILMNTLRGDMRSVDARYMELAQMVGEEAARETPPEVLAMLMGQMGAQQAGIGALPQGQDMMPPGAGMPPAAQPPGAGMPPPDQMGAPQPAPAMPQGGIPMPEGMESAPPFSPGAEEAPQQFAYGGEVEAPQGYAVGGLVRGAQFLGDKASQYGSAANAALGRMFMTPQASMTQPYLENLRGPTGRFTAEQIQRGGDVSLLQPTFTQGLQMGASQLANRIPGFDNFRQALPSAATIGAALGAMEATDIRKVSPPSLVDQIPRDTRESLINQIPTSGYPEAPLRPGEGPRPPRPAAPPMVAQEMVFETPADDLGAFITDKLGAFDKRQKDTGVAAALKETAKPRTKAERIKAAQGEYNTMFSEILGDDKESAKINALLLLSEAGLKLASTRKPTFAMALADAASGLPRGMAAIAAQERELSIKGKSAALQQAITDVTAQDAAAAARQNMIAEYALKGKVEQMKNQGVIYKDGGAGMLIPENKAGSRVGQPLLDPTYVESVKQNPIALSFNEADANPFVRDLGPANTVVARDPKQRAKIEEDMNIIAGQLATIRSMEDVVAQAYSPGTFFTGVKNEYFVPLLPDAIASPDVNKAKVVSILKNGFSDLARGRASQDGRLSVQQEKWQRENDDPIAKPDGLLQDPELAAKVLRTKRTSLENEWYSSATKLGVFDRNRVIDTPPTGTKNDPFVIPSDARGQAQMMNFLRTNFGSVQDPRAMIHVRKPNGERVSLSIQNLLNPTER